MPDLSPFARACRTFGSNIRRLRRAKSWTQIETAVAAEMYWRHYQRVEYGQINVTIATMVKIATALGSDLTTLLTERSRP